ncbi:MAG: hypothetical protein QXU88_00955 [Candidatus Woesearchaeota archaeon]
MVVIGKRAVVHPVALTIAELILAAIIVLAMYNFASRAREPGRLEKEFVAKDLGLLLDAVSVGQGSYYLVYTSPALHQDFKISAGAHEVVVDGSRQPYASGRIEIKGDSFGTDKLVIWSETGILGTPSAVKGHLLQLPCESPLSFSTDRQLAVAADDGAKQLVERLFVKDLGKRLLSNDEKGASALLKIFTGTKNGTAKAYFWKDDKSARSLACALLNSIVAFEGTNSALLLPLNPELAPKRFAELEKQKPAVFLELGPDLISSPELAQALYGGVRSG